jgi:hypothetical protein
VNGVPALVARILAAMRLGAAKPARWDFSEAEWRAALYYLDRNQMALLVRHCLGDALPEPIRRRLDNDYAIHRARLRRIHTAYAEVSGILSRRGLQWTLLKGFAGVEDYYADPDARVQYDLDLYCPESPHEAQSALISAGYRPGRETGSADHLAPLTRESNWSWRGDFFDPGIPIAVEVHFRLWDEGTERFAAPGLPEFWERRTGDALHPVDALGYKALHLLRHLLRGEFRAAHLYEIAWFLHQRASDDLFWAQWREMHEPGLRRLESIAFELGRGWFDARLPEGLEPLPAGVTGWLRDDWDSPARAYFQPNKDELRLHLLLVESSLDKLRVLRRRLLPGTLPRTPLGTRSGQLRYLAGRAAFHLRSLVSAIASAQKYKGSTRQ